jgi:2-dehydropantoate 2-reductase
MKVCVVGLGAIGSYLASCLEKGGCELSALCRESSVDFFQNNGIQIRNKNGCRRFPISVDHDPNRLGPQDYVIVSMKTHQSWAVADTLGPLLNPQTKVVVVQNGIPWWYFYNLAGPFRDQTLISVDPEARQMKTIGAERAIGCVAYTTASQSAPGVTEVMNAGHFRFGDPSSAEDTRLAPLLAVLTSGGLSCSHVADIRYHVWHKLLGNVCLNPVSVLTGATMDVIATDPGLRQVCLAMMHESAAVAQRLGITLEGSPETRLDHSATLGAHRTSMLQDLDAGRPIEVDSLTGAVSEIADILDHPTPMIDAILALVKQRGREAGVYPAFPKIT